MPVRHLTHFQNDESMVEYQPVVGAVFKGFQAAGSNASPASLVAEVIHTAATDGKSTLRYRAGADAEYLLDNRKKMDDEEFTGMMKKQFGM